MQMGGLKIYGASMFNDIKKILCTKLDKMPVNHLIDFYKNVPYNERDVFCSELIWNNFDKNMSNILIVGGNVPLIYLDKFKNYNLTYIDNNPCLSYCSDYIRESFNCQVINLNPITEDIATLISQNDLIIYPETETLIPFDLLRYKHKNKMIFCSNFFYYDFKLNNNLIYDENDLKDICEIETVLIKGTHSLNFENKKRNFYYVMGNAN
jgi:hypothetical protein